MLKYITNFISHSQSYCLPYPVGVAVSYDVNPTDSLRITRGNHVIAQDS